MLLYSRWVISDLIFFELPVEASCKGFGEGSPSDGGLVFLSLDPSSFLNAIQYAQHTMLHKIS